MTICRPEKLNRKIRHLKRVIKINKALAKASQADAEYHKAMRDKFMKLAGFKVEVNR